ncbi:hypothetical protein EVAR_95359_1 [Eumeta japonica]|uniref:Uncharacterized protein n=1 Tax=Eumeta variegata TaxID=151549 RepID=A0A4C1U9I1_EUMVA|nr:hypothetical protein EVAR_95359_1 [Eumeta japonica]
MRPLTRETPSWSSTEGPPSARRLATTAERQKWGRRRQRAAPARAAAMNKRNRVYARRPLTAPGERPSSTSGKSYPQKEILQLSNAQEHSATPAAAAPPTAERIR